MGIYSIQDINEPNVIKRGPLIMEDGNKYFGQFKLGKRHGKGKQVWEDYSLY